jgi:phosphoribosylamine--glycine ligase
MTSHRYVAEGIVPLCDSYHDLVDWVKSSPEPAMLLFDSSGMGKLADDARKSGIHVIGGGSFCDRLEKDRAFGRKIAQDNGIDSPPFVEFSSIEECIGFAKAGGVDRPVYWKTDAYIEGDATHKCEDAEDLVDYLTYMQSKARPGTKCILEEALDGFALSTARYWNGRAWVGPYEATLERKPFMPGNVGPSTGCSINAVTFYADDTPTIAQMLNWDGLSAPFLKYEAPPGLYDINAIVGEGEAHFLEWTPRFGYDSEPTSNLLFDNYSEWLWQVATGQGNAEPSRDEIALSIRISVPPAPWEHGERDEKGSAVGVPIRGAVGDLWSEGFMAYQVMVDENGLAVAAPEGLVGLSTAVGDTVSELADDVIDFAKDELRIPGKSFWAVGVGEAIQEDAGKCADNGVDDLHEGLFK